MRLLLLALLVACSGDKDDDPSDDGGADDTGGADGGDGGDGGDGSDTDPPDEDDDGYDAESDCNDSDPEIHPRADERCNEQDDDCDDEIDEDATDALTGWPDADSDGFGDDAGAVTACDLPDGLIDQGGDCNDLDPAIHPGMEDIVCNNIDEDCDGAVDGGWRVPEDQLNIQTTMNTAPAGSTICVGPGTWVGGIDFQGKALRVLGREGPETTIIDATSAFGAVYFGSGEGSDSILEGFTITGGLADQGAGITIINASPTLRDLIVSENACIDSTGSGRCEGTGLWISGGSALLEDVLFTGNRQEAAVCLGAGAFIGTGSTPTLRRVRFEGNEQQAVSASAAFLYGAGMMIEDARPTLEEVEITGNSQDQGSVSSVQLHGAGLVFHGGGGSPTDLVLSENTQTCGGGTGCNAYGAGLYLYGSTTGDVALQLDAAEILDNSMTLSATGTNQGYGAGIAAYAGVQLELARSVVARNSMVASGTGSLGNGGGLYGRTDVLFTLLNTIVAGNSVTAGSTSGGALALYEGADATLTNSILAGNELIGSSSGRGAAVFARDNTIELTQVDVTGNRCTSGNCRGAAFNLYSGSSLVLDGVNVVGNTGSSGSYGTVYGEFSGSTLSARYSNFHGTGGGFYNVTSPSAADGNLFVDPLYTDTSSSDPLSWDLSLQTGSPVIDAGDPTVLDPDGSRADIGAYGGPWGAW